MNLHPLGDAGNVILLPSVHASTPTALVDDPNDVAATTTNWQHHHPTTAVCIVGRLKTTKKERKRERERERETPDYSTTKTGAPFPSQQNESEKVNDDTHVTWNNKSLVFVDLRREAPSPKPETTWLR